jgi:hypothetical protein
VDIGWQTCTFLALFVGMPLLIVYSTIDVQLSTSLSHTSHSPFSPSLARASPLVHSRETRP